jgi:hypothetical protein
MKVVALSAGMLLILAAFALAADVCVDNTAPTAPSSLAIADSPYDADGNILLTWAAASDFPDCSGIGHYNIYESEDGTSFAKVGQTSELTYNVFGLEQGKKYYFRVSAVDKVVINPNEGAFAAASTTIGAASSQPTSSGTTSSGGGSSGGGGGGGGSYGNWSCSEWSACSSAGKQTRTCTNSKSQYMTAGKPAESQGCTYTAPVAPKVIEEIKESASEQTPAAQTTAEDLLTSAAPTKSTTGFSAVTGMLISNISKPSIWITIIAVLALAGIGLAGYGILRRKN